MATKQIEKKSRIISISVDNLSFRDSIDRIADWGLKRQSGFVCFANVHMIIEAYNDPRVRQAIQKASLVLPDGKPLAFACEWFYNQKQERVAGMDFMPALFEEIAEVKGKIFLFGSTKDVLDRFIDRVEQYYPGIEVVGAVSPPFRKLSEPETKSYIEQINSSKANFILVALGCPKQERWMAENSSAISGIMLGLGGAFSVFAGVHKRCPRWMRDHGLEWLFRLMLEPKRLFKRYCVTNVKFIYLFVKETWNFRRRVGSLN